MSLCKYSSEFIASNSTTIDNSFINDYMLNAPDKCVKVYLYGLYKCNNPESLDNSLEDFAKVLNYSTEDIISAFMYWEDLNLIQIISKEPMQVRFLPIKSGSSQLKKFNTQKYKSFNIQAQEIIESRMITPSEYQEYYYLIENKHIEADALIMIIKYCVSMKGANISSSYILTVAKNWVSDGVLTCDDVEARLKDLERNSEDVQAVLKALGIKRSTATEEEYSLYLEWKDKLEMPLEIILYLAKKAKSKGAGFKKLDGYVSKCYALRLESITEIKDYYDQLDLMYEIAKDVCKNLGIRYDNMEIVVDNYISKWLNLGFDKESLVKIANYSFRLGIKSLEGMEGKVNSMYKLGLINSTSIDNHIQDLAKFDSKIKEILEKLGIERGVSSSDRTMYRTWIINWQLDEELILYAVSSSSGVNAPMQYLNKILASYHENNVKSVEEAKKLSKPAKSKTNNTCENAKGDKYSKAELNSLINNLFEVEI